MINVSNFKILINFLRSLSQNWVKRVDLGRICITSNKNIIITGYFMKAVRFGDCFLKILELLSIVVTSLGHYITNSKKRKILRKFLQMSWAFFKDQTKKYYYYI